MQPETKKQAATTGLPVSFSGAIAAVYEEILGDFLFEPYAANLVQRISLHADARVLELACGTGRVTKKLLQQLPASVQVIATDLEADMIGVAKHNNNYPNLRWATVDMTDIPFATGQFDIVVCQFGLMLVPDKLKALEEMYRVLQPGGRLIFSVWGNINNNAVWRIAGEVLGTFLGINPMIQDPGPFSMNDQQTLQWLKNTGFAHYNVTTVKLEGTIPTAALAAKGFTNGLPVSLAINKKAPALLPQIEKALEVELMKQLGNHPLQSPLQAWLFEAIK